MRIFAVLAGGLFVSLVNFGDGRSQTDEPVPAVSLPSQSTTVPIDALQHWRRSTIGIGRTIQDGDKLVFTQIGTGVLVAKDARHGCLVTAKHVFFDPSQGYAPDYVMIRLPRETGGVEDDPGVKLELITSGGNVWKSLPDGSDLAVAPLPDLSKYWNIDAVGMQDLGGEGDVYQGANVIVLGYPAIVGQYYLKSPLARQGIVSWVDPDNGSDNPFLVDANLYNGNSGGPVFRVRSGLAQDGSVIIGGGYALIGIVSKGPLQNAPVVAGGVPISSRDPATGIPIQEFAQVANVGGIGIIEPVSKVRKLVEEHCFH